MDLCRRVASLRRWRPYSSPSSSSSSSSSANAAPALMGTSLKDLHQVSEARTIRASTSPAQDLQRISHERCPFSSLIAKLNNFTIQDINSHHHHHHPCHLFPLHRMQQVRHVYVEVIDNDIDAAVKVYRKKMLNTKIEDKLREKRYYSKPSERRKLAKHYKKLNRARRELTAKIRTVKHRMEKIQEVRKIEKEEKRAKAAAAAASASSQGPKFNGR